MCGRYALHSQPKVIARLYGLKAEPVFKSSYNIAPSYQIPVVRETKEHGRECVDIKWGLIPSWARDPAIGNKLNNARSETAAEKPSFRSAFARRRCLIPADGFYEWKPVPGAKTKQPYFIHMKDGSPFSMAGLWEQWRSPEGEVIESVAILTTDGNELMREIHNRMPVILAADDYDSWLFPDNQDKSVLQEMMKPYPSGEMTADKVSTRVNRPQHDDPECIARLDA